MTSDATMHPDSALTAEVAVDPDAGASSPQPSALHLLRGPLYPRLLRLRHVQPSAWQRALLVEGTLLVGALAALADKVTAWAPLILLVAVAAIVKFHDLLTGVLHPVPDAPDADGSAAVAAEPVRAVVVEPSTVRVIPPVDARAGAREDARRLSAERAAQRAAEREAARERARQAAAGRTAQRSAAREAAKAAAAALAAEHRAAQAAAAAQADLGLLEAQATVMAAELLALDGAVHAFAIGLEPDGEVTLVSAEEAYDRVPDAVRVAALWREVRRLAADGALRAAAVAVPEGSHVRLEVEGPGADPVAAVLLPDRHGELEVSRRTEGSRRVPEWAAHDPRL